MKFYSVLILTVFTLIATPLLAENNDELVSATTVAVYNDFGAPSVVAQQRDCQNKDKTQVVQFATKIPNYDFSKALSAALVAVLEENDYKTVTVTHLKTLSAQQADYLITVVAVKHQLPWDQEHIINNGYGIYSKAVTKGYFSYQMILENLQTHQKMTISQNFLSTDLPDSKLLPKYATCPIVAIDMPREDLLALQHWLAKQIIPKLQRSMISGLEASEPAE